MKMFLNVHVMNARELPKMNFFGSLNPSCTIQFGQQNKSTFPIKHNNSPRWNEYFTFEVDSINDKLCIFLYNKKFNKNKKFGKIEIEFARIPYMQIVDQWFDIEPCGKNKYSGQLRVRIHLCGEFGKAFDHFDLPRPLLNNAPFVSNIYDQINQPIEFVDSPYMF